MPSEVAEYAGGRRMRLAVGFAADWAVELAPGFAFPKNGGSGTRSLYITTQKRCARLPL